MLHSYTYLISYCIYKKPMIHKCSPKIVFKEDTQVSFFSLTCHVPMDACRVDRFAKLVSNQPRSQTLLTAY